MANFVIYVGVLTDPNRAIDTDWYGVSDSYVDIRGIDVLFDGLFAADLAVYV